MGLEPITREEEYLSEIAETLRNGGGGGGGSGLPDVTDADNGKVLGVVNGAWGKTDVAAVIATITPNVEEGTATVDKTYAELVEAWEAGKVVRGVLSTHGDNEIYAFEFSPVSGFNTAAYAEGEIEAFRVRWSNSQSEWKFEYFDYAFGSNG